MNVVLGASPMRFAVQCRNESAEWLDSYVYSNERDARCMARMIVNGISETVPKTEDVRVVARTEEDTPNGDYHCPGCGLWF